MLQGLDAVAQGLVHRHLPQPVQEVVGVPAPDAQALAAHERATERDELRSRADDALADHQFGTDLALTFASAVGLTIGTEPTRVGKRHRVTSIGLDAPGAGGVHRRKVRVGDDDFVAERLQATRHPFRLGHRLDQDARLWPLAELRGESLPIGPDPALYYLAGLRLDADLAIAFVQVDANMVHGWPPLRLKTASLVCGARKGYHVPAEASCFISSAMG